MVGRSVTNRQPLKATMTTPDLSTLRQDFQWASEHIEKLIDRRQDTTSFFLSVNTGILAAIGLLAKDSQMQASWLSISVALLLVAGLIACWIWRSLLQQYDILLNWWYARMRELEAGLPGSARLVTREYEDLYGGGRPKAQKVGMTRRELVLVWIFVGLYVAFMVGIVLSWLYK